MDHQLDTIDLEILTKLQLDASLTNQELAESVGLSPSSCLRRVKALEVEGFIKDTVVRLNAKALGFSKPIYVTITLTTQAGAALAEFEEAVKKIPEVMDCCLLAGNADYILRLRVRGMDDYERVHFEHLTKLPHLERVTTQFVVRDVLRRNALPIKQQ